MTSLNEPSLRRTLIVLSLMIIVLSASLVTAYLWMPPQSSPMPIPQDFYMGVTAGGPVAETKALIDKVKSYTNMIIFTNLYLIENKSSLEEVCSYAYNANLSFLVFMVYPVTPHIFNFDPIAWVSEAKSKYGAKFMGYYLWDEPGGNQLDRGNFRQFDNTTMPSNYRDAANTYVYYLYVQMRDFIKTEKLFTSDYGLYWYDYEAGYDVVLGEFTLNDSRPLTIAQCRGAADMHNRTWGVMITRTNENESQVETPAALYEDMVIAYDAGAKYVAVFNYPQIGQYGLLSEDHFNAIKAFRDYVVTNPQNETSDTQRLAYVLPDNYGFGFRRSSDTIWGVWPADNISQTIWNNAVDLERQYGDNFDILIGSPWTRLFGREHYDQLIWWNGTRFVGFG